MMLNDRKKQILKSIVDAYIDSGEPVGSKFLTSYGNISLSPATIRNEMSELEEMGYLDKPHTSAGRVPSSSAYRLYVDELMGSYRLTMEELNVINELMHFKMSELDKIITQASKVMSDLTNCVTVSFTQEASANTVSRFDTVFVDETSFLLVMISGGNVRSEHVKTDCYLTRESLSLICELLNRHLSGIPLERVTMPLIMEMENEAGALAPLINPIIRVAFRCVEPEADGSVHINGLSNLLAYPEFSDTRKLRSIMDVFDKKKSYIKQLLTEPAKADAGESMGLVPIKTDSGMKIFIGDEGAGSELADTSLVFCTVPVGDTESVIGILGPKRMDYKKMVSTLKQFSDTIEQAAKRSNTNKITEDIDGREE
jgi:heat-inducible transcriptional repressor